MAMSWCHSYLRNYFRSRKLGFSMNQLRICVAAGGIALFGLKSCIHLFPGLCVKIYGAKNVDEDIPDSIREVLRQKITELNMCNPNRVSLFVNNGFYAVSAGSTLLPNGAVIGIPRTFLFNNVKQIEDSTISFQKQPIDWNTRIGKQLEKCLIPLPEHISFSLAHELSHIKEHDFVIRATLPVLWYYLTYKVCVLLLKAAKVHWPSKLRQLTLMAFVCVSSFMAYCQCIQSLMHYQEFRADETAARCSKDNCHGGIDYMERKIQRNLLLRSLTDHPEKSGLSESGEDVYYNSHPSMKKRIQRLKRIKAQYFGEPV